MTSKSIYTTPRCSCIICRKECSAKGIYTHYLHSHCQSFRESWLLANTSREKISRNVATIKKHKEKRVLAEKVKYNKQPVVCKTCNSPIEFGRNVSFCTASCRATYTNRKRKESGWSHSEESKNKTREKLIGRKQTHRPRKYCSVCFYACSVCGATMMSRSKSPGRKTCSRKCQIYASTNARPYINGRRLNIYYKHRSGETVLLESSWEEKLAVCLDALLIDWVRPEPIEWFDGERHRLYYPDFFLPNVGLYLDPKNPTCLSHSIDKMIIVSSIIPLWYGDITTMISEMPNVRDVGFEPTTRMFAPDPKSGGMSQTNRIPDIGH